MRTARQTRRRLRCLLRGPDRRGQLTFTSLRPAAKRTSLTRCRVMLLAADACPLLRFFGDQISHGRALLPFCPLDRLNFLQQVLIYVRPNRRSEGKLHLLVFAMTIGSTMLRECSGLDQTLERFRLRSIRHAKHVVIALQGGSVHISIIRL